MTEINNINDKPTASIEGSKENNAPTITDEDRQKILNSEQEAVKKPEESSSNGDKPIEPSSKETGNPINLSVGEREGLSADDLSQVNQTISNFKRELREEEAEKLNAEKRLKEDIRQQVINEIREQEEKKRLEQSVSQTTQSMKSMEEQIKALQEKINNPKVGQEVSSKSPFDNEADIENMTPEKERQLDEASKIAFMKERFSKI